MIRSPIRFLCGSAVAGLVTITAAMVLLLLASPARALGVADASAATEDQRLRDFFQQVYERNLKDSPRFQASIGLKGVDYGKWDDVSDSEATRQQALRVQDLTTLRESFDTAKLSSRLRLSHRLFEFQSEGQIAAYPWRHHSYAFSTMGNLPSELVTFLRNIHRVDELADAEAYIARVRGIEAVLTEAVKNARDAADHGIVPTSLAFLPVIADVGTQLRGAPLEAGAADHPLLEDFRAKVEALTIAPEEKARLLDELSTALTGTFRRGVEAYLAMVKALQPLSKGPHGVWALPDGAAFYRNRVAYYTTDSALDAEQIHAYGMAEVERIHGEMEAIRARLGFDGDLQAFFQHLRSDPANFFPNTDAGRQAYLDQSKAYIDSIYADVGRYFNRLPKAPLEVRRVEPWREATSPNAFYSLPAVDGSRPGIYYVNLHNMASVQKHEVETIAYHEGAPGHHFQVAIQQELQEVPEFQKFTFHGAYVEGWALYAELLAKEQGRFTDPLQDFGRLQNEMMRAVRLVVDTGAHSKRWTREQMIDFMMRNTAMSPATVEREVERYIDLPGQALSYKVGMQRIVALRERGRAALGERFDLRAFHDVVLQDGGLPLLLLEQQVDAWIEKQPASTGAGH